MTELAVELEPVADIRLWIKEALMNAVIHETDDDLRYGFLVSLGEAALSENLRMELLIRKERYGI